MRPGIWLSLLVIWFGVLWMLSSRSGDLKEMPSIPFFDKVAHFGYFLGGGFLFSGYLVARNAHHVRWSRLFAMVFLGVASIGILDEYHQTFTPGRSGNDPFDWLADVLGGLAGAVVFRGAILKAGLLRNGSSPT